MRAILVMACVLMSFASAHAKERLTLLDVESSSSSSSSAAAPSAPKLVGDVKPGRDPDLSKFRTTSSPFQPPDAEDANPREPASAGLTDVRASGSSQFSVAGLARVASATGRPLVVVDLREESHGFQNGRPVSWAGPDNAANVGLSLDGVRAAEQKALRALDGDVMSEKRLCKKAGVSYVRIPVTDHRRPLDEDVDRFLKLVRRAPGAWLHFHCKAGKGRTTTFMTMFDMVHNARRLSADEIAYRQHRLGGSNLLEGTPDEGEEDSARERVLFLRRFHAYCRQNRDGFKTSWSRWLAGQESSSSPSATLPSLR